MMYSCRSIKPNYIHVYIVGNPEHTNVMLAYMYCALKGVFFSLCV